MTAKSSINHFWTHNRKESFPIIAYKLKINRIKSNFFGPDKVKNKIIIRYPEVFLFQPFLHRQRIQAGCNTTERQLPKKGS